MGAGGEKGQGTSLRSDNCFSKWGALNRPTNLCVFSFSSLVKTAAASSLSFHASWLYTRTEIVTKCAKRIWVSAPVHVLYERFCRVLHEKTTCLSPHLHALQSTTKGFFLSLSLSLSLSLLRSGIRSRTHLSTRKSSARPGVIELGAFREEYQSAPRGV